MQQIRKVIFSTLIIFIAGALNVDAQSSVGPTGRTTADVQRDSMNRNRDLGIEQYEKLMKARANSSAGSTGGGRQMDTKKDAFRSGILATQTTQELTVSKVVDGDTLEVTNAGRTSTLHIIGADAPEKGQPGWKEAKDKLSEILVGKTVTIKYSRYCPRHKSGVFLTRVIFEGNDIGEYLIKNGFAWYDEKYDIFFSKDEDKANIEMWKTARSQKLGIWKDGKASEPWDYAKKSGKITP